MLGRAFHRSSLRIVITVVFAVLLSIMAGLTWFLTYRNGQVSIRELAGQVGRQSMLNIHRQLEDYLRGPRLINEINAFSFQQDAVTASGRRVMGMRFLAELTRFPTVVSIAYADEEGQYFGVSRDVGSVPLSLAIADRSTDGHLEGWQIDQAGRRLRRFAVSEAPFDPRKRPWYTSAVSAGAPVWTPVYLWVSGDAGLDAVTAVRDGTGRLQGVLDVSLTLSGIGTFLKGIGATSHSTAFILERSGLLVAASTIATPYRQSGVTLDRLSAAQSGDLVIQSASAEIARVLAAPGGITGDGDWSFTLAGIRENLRVAPFSDGPGLDWLVAEVIPESDLAQQIYKDMRSTAVFVALFLALSMGVAMLLAQRIAGPLKVLSGMARGFARGELGQPIVVEGTDEVGQLAASFNVLAEELRRSFGSLTESEARYRSLFEGMPVGLFRADESGAIEKANPRLRAMFGFSESDSLAEVNAFSLLSDPDNRLRLRSLLQGDGSVQDADVRMRRRDGHTFWARAHVRAVRSPDGSLHYEGSMVDVTERKRVEDALRRSEVRYRNIFHRSAVSLWEADISELRTALDTLALEGTTDPAAYMERHPDYLHAALRMIRVVDVNDTTLRLFEAGSREELLGPLSAAFDESALSSLIPAAIANAETGRQHEIETRVITRAGTPLDVIIHFYIPEEGETLTNMLVSVVDITKRTQAERERAVLEDQLRHAQKVETIGRLAAGIAHDINNLLTPILGYGELLLDLPSDSPRREAAEQILGASRRIRDLTSNLLAFGRKQQLTRDVVDLRVVASEFQKLLRRTLRADIQIHYSDTGCPAFARVDAGQVEQVLMNLAVNAQDAMPQGGTLTLELGEEVLDEGRARAQPGAIPGRHVTIRVSDTGQGMDEQTRDRVFEPFFTTKEPGKGTGLGLSVVYGIVKQHGGLIEVDSRPGRGAVFTICLPAI
jgi:PAS domain S-box-containing protein